MDNREQQPPTYAELNALMAKAIEDAKATLALLREANRLVRGL